MRKEHVVILLEEMQSNFKLVLESHHALRQEMHGLFDSLGERIDGVESTLNAKIQGVHDKLTAEIHGVHDKLDAKIDALAVDLSAHRADTEVHAVGGYRVGEK